MRITDYIFRTIALLLIWCSLTFLAYDGDIFIPEGWFGFALCALFFLTGIILTITIWCGPDMVRSPQQESKKAKEE